MLVDKGSRPLYCLTPSDHSTQRWEFAIAVCVRNLPALKTVQGSECGRIALFR
jgi:hypothetical protein